MAVNPSLVIRVAANLDELKRNLAEGQIQIETTTARMEKLATSLSGGNLIQRANDIVAAVDKIGGAAKLTEGEQARVNATLDKAIQKYQALGKDVPKAMSDLHDATTKVSTSTGFLETQVGKLVAAFSVTAILKFAQHIGESAGELVDLSNKTGESIETLQKLRFVGSQTGVALDDFATASFKLGVNLEKGGAQATTALHAIGISIQTIKGLAPEEQFDLVARALSQVTSDSERNRIGVDLMGKSYGAIAPAIKEYGQLIDRAHIATADHVKSADHLADSAAELKGAFDALMTDTMGRVDEGIHVWGTWFAATRDFILRMHGAGGTIETTTDALEVQTHKIEDNARAQVMLAKIQDPLGQQAKLNAQILDDYGKALAASGRAADLHATALEKVEARLRAQENVLNSIAPAVKKHIADLITQGASVDELVAAYEDLKVTPAIISAIVDEQKAAAKAADEHTKAIEKQTQAVFDATKAQEAEAVAVQKAMQARLDAMVVEQQAAAVKLALAGVSAGVVRGQAIGVGVLAGTPNVGGALGGPPSPYQAIDLSGLTGTASDFMTAMQRGPSLTDAQKRSQTLTQATAYIGSISSTLGPMVGGTTGQALSSGSNTLGGLLSIAQFQKQGGGIGKAGAAAGAITGGVEGVMEMAHAKGYAANILGGVKTGASIGMLAGPMGAAVGAGVGAAVGAIKAAVATPGRDAVKDFASASGGFDELHKKLETLGAAGEKMWVSLTQGTGSKNTKQAQQNIDAITKAFADQQKEVEATAAAVEKYGLTWADMNGAKQIEAVGKQFQSVAADADRLSKAGYTTAGIVRGMAGDLNNLLSTAMSTGQKLPASLAPYMHELVTSGGLTDDLKKKLLGIADPVPWQDMKQAADKYGISINDLGVKFQQSRLDEMSKDLNKDWHLLVDNGADVNAVILGMSGKVNDLVHDSLKFGTTIPENMKPMLQKMVDAGQLTDDTGQKLTDLTKLTFSHDISEDFDKLIGKIDELIDKLSKGLPGGAQTGTDDVTTVVNNYRPPRVVIPVVYANPDNPPDLTGESTRSGPGRQTTPAFARGGVVTRPTYALVGEAGPEAIVPLGSDGAMAGVSFGDVHITTSSTDGRRIARDFMDELRGRIARGEVLIPTRAVR